MNPNNREQIEQIALKGAEAFKQEEYQYAKELLTKAISMCKDDLECFEIIQAQVLRIDKIITGKSLEEICEEENILREIEGIEGFLYLMRRDAFLYFYSIESLEEKFVGFSSFLDDTLNKGLFGKERYEKIKNEMKITLKRRPTVTDTSLAEKLVYECTPFQEFISNLTSF